MQRYLVPCNSSWLDDLQGGFPLLKGPEMKFVSDMCSTMRNSMPLEADEFYSSTRGVINREPPSITEDFKRVVGHLRKSSSARIHFLRTYVGWRVYRGRTVTQLMKIADSIDKVKENCEMAKIIASGLSLFGGGLCLLAEDKKRDRSGEIGSAMMGIGNIAAAGATAFGTFLLHENIEAAKQAIEEDREHLKGLWTWCQDSGDLLRSLNNIKSVESSGNLQTIARNLQSLYKRGMNARRTQSEMRMILKSINCPPYLRHGIADVMGVLVSTNMLCERYRPLFKLVEDSSACLPSLRFAIDLYRSASGISTALSVGRNFRMDQVQRDGVINGICLDAVNIVLSAAEMDSKSAESEKIREAVDVLSKEADTFETLYDTMMEMNSLMLE